jgi:hypothetical protein
LVEIVELKDHPWFVASQFHPEFRSRPGRPHPLFREFVRAAASRAGVLKPLGDYVDQRSASDGGVERHEIRNLGAGG